MKRYLNKVVLLFYVLGIFPPLTVVIFYLLVWRVYVWNGMELPFWKHPLKSEIPFIYHNQSIHFLTLYSEYIAMPLMALLFLYFAVSKQIKFLQKKTLTAIALGILFYIIMTNIDPLGVYVWWLD